MESLKIIVQWKGDIVLYSCDELLKMCKLKFPLPVTV